jgi:ketosteroid isomerase-like protein
MLRARDERAITKTFTGYVQAFQTLNPPTVLPYCHAPCLLISPQGVRLMETPAEVEALFARMFEGLQARRYARSEVTDPHVNQVSEHIAFVSVSRVRYATDGQELERLGETYTFRKTDDGWKIVVATVHDPDTLVRLAWALTPAQAGVRGPSCDPSSGMPRTGKGG